MRSLRLVLVVAFLAGAACGGEDEPTVEPEASPAPSATSEPAESPAPSPSEEDFPCSNQADSLEQAGDLGNPLEGDVDGDGSDDSVSIVVDPDGDPGCQAFIVMETAAGTASAPIDQEGMSLDLGFPALVTLVQIDGVPGLDVVVNLVAGASTQFAGVFTFSDGAPQRLRFDQPTEFGDLFPTGGSTGHLEASDCVGPGAIVISQAVPREDEYKVTRTAYVVVDGRLTPQEEGVTTARLPLEHLDRFPEFRASPFGSCPAG
jgi:hypothetical protein